MTSIVHRRAMQEEPGTVTFWWKVSSEANCDWLSFYADGVLQDRISREIPVDYLPDVRREAMRREVPTIRLPMPPSKCMRSDNDYRKA